MIDKQFNRHIIPNLPQENPKAMKAQNTIVTNLDIITQESNRLARLINDVLDLAKIESGKMSWNFEDLQLEQLFERAFNNLSSLTENSKIELELKYAYVKPPLIQGDRDRILQVMTNLISNAIKFTKDGRITCRVECKESWIQCSVKDTGIGIVEEDLLKVFDKFQQVGDTLTDKPQGTGLGLPICKEIIEVHNGQIWADSKPEKGSTFYFALPFDPKVAVPETVKEVTLKLENKLDKMEKSEYLILIADEDEGVRELIKQSLEIEGYRTIQAVNGKEAYDLAREYPVNAIIIDIMMYDIDGFDTPHYLKSDDLTKDIPIMLLSIILNQKNEMVLGANSYITDPVDSEKILDRLNEIVRNTHSPLSSAKACFVGFPRSARKSYQTELKNMGIHVEYFDTSGQFSKSLEADLPTAIFIDFKDFDISPNQFFKMVKRLDRTKKLPVIAVIHAGQVAQVIDSAPIKGLCSTIDITNSINELFGKRIRG
ncbi:hybrid sensor histidine kinase/response regulator [bacterium]|nr:hybrid sensor histidine kinase/response regulator [bacterium]